MNKRIATKTIVMMGVFIALHIVLSRFLSISTWNLKIGFAFVPLMLCALLLGPIHACIVGAVSDFLGAILFPIGPYFPGFTLTVALTGLMFGLVFHKKQSLLRSLIAALINQGVIGLIFTTFFISVLYGTPFPVLLATRSIQAAIMFVVEFLVIYFVTVKFGTRIKRALRIGQPAPAVSAVTAEGTEALETAAEDIAEGVTEAVETAAEDIAEGSTETESISDNLD